MKTLILAFLLLGSSVSYACSCMNSNFKSADTERAITNFLSSNMGIASSRVLEVEHISSKYFVTRGIKILFGLFGVSKRSCEYGCAMGMNVSHRKAVKFLSNNQECTVNLKVIMKSAMTNDTGYSSKVIQIGNPVCK